MAFPRGHALLYITHYYFFHYHRFQTNLSYSSCQHYPLVDLGLQVSVLLLCLTNLHEHLYPLNDTRKYTQEIYCVCEVLWKENNYQKVL